MKKFLSLLVLSFFATTIFASNQTMDLVIGYKTVYFAGHAKKAISVNQKIPGPLLHFKENDHITLNVYNHLDEETAIHWHGLIVPWQMDGVLGINQQGIPPGGVFHYAFTLKQSGTYWYHAHAGLQEQQGLYGAFIIDPLKAPSYTYTKDFSLVFSDWSNTAPRKILANLKKTGGYYSPRFPLQPSLMKYIRDYRHATPSQRQQLMNDYKTMQQTRMGIYDMSDVAYDAFLLNGQSNKAPWTGLVKVGDTVRLRLIGAGAGTIFRIKVPGTTMQVIQMDGNDIKPYSLQQLTLAPGETTDVLVHIEKNEPYLIVAQSFDTVGQVVGALITEPWQTLNIKTIPHFLEPPPVTQEMMSLMMGEMNQNNATAMNMSGMNMSGMSRDMKMNNSTKPAPPPMANMTMPTESTLMGDHISSPNTSFSTSKGTKYQPLIAAVKTNDPSRPVTAVINMELFGYMDRFMWFINGVPEYKAKPIVLDPNKRYRIIFKNTSMMHHPMHLHGHWFILRKGEGAYDPLLHTIDIPPGATITADVDTDASGQWFFHCHLLYHMAAGMARVIQYSTVLELAHDKMKPQNIVSDTLYDNRPIVRVDDAAPLDLSLIKHPMAHPKGFWFASFLEGGFDPFNNSQRANYKGLYGPDNNKLELLTKDAEMNQGSIENADIDVFYWHGISQFWAIKGGVNYFYRPAKVPYWQPGMGLEGLMPYFVDTDIRTYFYEGSAKLDIDLSRDTQITNNFFIRTGARGILASKTVPRASLGRGLNQMRYVLRPYYRIAPGFDVYAEFEHQQNYGRFKQLQRYQGEASVEDTLMFGLSILL